MAQEQSIKISLDAYQELILRKISTGVPITKQIDKLLVETIMPKNKKGFYINDKKSVKRS